MNTHSNVPGRANLESPTVSEGLSHSSTMPSIFSQAFKVSKEKVLRLKKAEVSFTRAQLCRMQIFVAQYRFDLRDFVHIAVRRCAFACVNLHVIRRSSKLRRIRLKLGALQRMFRAFFDHTLQNDATRLRGSHRPQTRHETRDSRDARAGDRMHTHLDGNTL